jgi:hypothetical protein
VEASRLGLLYLSYQTSWPLEGPGRPLEDAFAVLEAWSADQGLPAVFKVVVAACAPTGLTTRLAALGYPPRTDAIVMTGHIAGGG